MHEAGKGDSRRPMAISDQQYAQRWDLIFGRDKDEGQGKGSDQEDEQRMGLEGQAQHHGEGRNSAPLTVGNQGSNNV
jgi:hypothetical protein